MNEEMCVICASNNDEERCTLNDCGHRFHANCIVGWFRIKKTCPLCRSVGKPLRICDIHIRANLLRRKALEKEASKELKRLANALRKMELKSKEARAALRTYDREHRSILAMHRKLLKRQNCAQIALHMARRRLGLHSDSTTPLPLIVERSRTNTHC